MNGARDENGVKENGTHQNGDAANGDGHGDECPATKKPRTEECGSEATPNSDFHFSSSPNLEDIRTKLADFSNERNWNKHHSPRNLLLAMVGEVGELAEIFQWKSECKDGLPDWTPAERMHLGEELSDVLIYLIRLADKCQVNLPEEVLRKIKMNGVKYPANRVNGSAKKYTAYIENGENLKIEPSN